MKELIKQQAELKMITIKEVARLSGMSLTTLWRRLKDPNKFTQGELMTLSEVLGLPVETLNKYIK